MVYSEKPWPVGALGGQIDNTVRRSGRECSPSCFLAQNTTSLYSIDRTISRPRPEFVTADPDFWKPKEPAKKEPARK